MENPCGGAERVPQRRSLNPRHATRDPCQRARGYRRSGTRSARAYATTAAYLRCPPEVSVPWRQLHTCCDDRLSRGHHRRVIRRPPVTIGPVGGIERVEIHLVDRVDHKPRQVIRRKPIPNIWRQQKPLLTHAFDEVLRHDRMVLIAADGTPLRDSVPLEPVELLIAAMSAKARLISGRLLPAAHTVPSAKEFVGNS